jgi:hypothetical protein
MTIKKIEGLYWIAVRLSNGHNYTVVNKSRIRGLRIAAAIAFK